ncbi:MAG: hypothetical protein NTW48_08410 [Chloroflexi bacterium]|nr:hypothetical protein [Chloroflexota bacterium]
MPTQLKIKLPEGALALYPLKGEEELSINMDRSFNLVEITSNADMVLAGTLAPWAFADWALDREKIIFQLPDYWIGVEFNEKIIPYQHPKNPPFSIRTKKKNKEIKLLLIIKHGIFSNNLNQLTDCPPEDVQYGRFIKLI